MISGHIDICDGAVDLGRDGDLRLDHGARRLHGRRSRASAQRSGGTCSPSLRRLPELAAARAARWSSGTSEAPVDAPGQGKGEA